MNAAQRNRHASLLKATGYEDGPALTLNSGDGDIPSGRELSLAWLAGTVLTGLTSVLLMGAALYVSFEGQDTFSTAYEALHIGLGEPAARTDLLIKTDRVRPVAETRSESGIVEASIRENVEGRVMIRRQPFVRVSATLATAGTSLSEDIPDYDVTRILEGAPSDPTADELAVNTDIYGAEVEGEVAVKVAALPQTLVPVAAITDWNASQYVRMAVDGGGFSEQDTVALAYAGETGSVRELGSPNVDVMTGMAENLTVLPKTTVAESAGLGRSERILTIKESGRLADVLVKNGFTEAMIAAISDTLRGIYPMQVAAGSRLRILFGPSRGGDTLVPHRLSIYTHNPSNNSDRHAATLALTDRGQYVLATEPPAIVFPEEDTEEVNVSNLPSIYRSLWETARKHDIDDATTKRIMALFAYDVDLTKKVAPGDLLEILRTQPDAEGRQELLYVGLTLGSTKRELFRFRSDTGKVDFFDPSGETGKRFLNRRPLKGGGTLRSRMGYRIHPIYKSRRMHTGVDLAAPSGTPIYASGDGVIEMSQWYSGYGRYIKIQHVNGFETAYGHMSRFEKGIKPGVRVRQGQVIGYVGSTGQSTGPHLHFEVKINGSFVDPLSVKLPRDKSLPAQSEGAFAETVAQIRDLMQRDAAPITLASN